MPKPSSRATQPRGATQQPGGSSTQQLGPGCAAVAQVEYVCHLGAPPMVHLFYGADMASPVTFADNTGSDYDDIMADLGPLRCEVLDYHDESGALAQYLYIEESLQSVGVGGSLVLSGLATGTNWDQRLMDWQRRLDHEDVVKGRWILLVDREPR